MHNITDLVVTHINTKGWRASRPSASSWLLIRESGKHKEGTEGQGTTLQEEEA